MNSDLKIDRIKRYLEKREQFLQDLSKSVKRVMDNHGYEYITNFTWDEFSFKFKELYCKDERPKIKIKNQAGEIKEVEVDVNLLKTLYENKDV